MKIKVIYYTSTFEKHFKRLPLSVKEAAIKKESVFRNNPTDSSLKTHALKNNLKGYFSFSINYHFRILFCIEDKESVTFIDIGSHSIYK